jgi:hypothetical protein
VLRSVPEAAAPPLGYLDISRRGFVRVAGSVVEARAKGWATSKGIAGMKRPIREWTQKSRKNAVRVIAACEVDTNAWDMITTTYGPESPQDGAIVHRHLQALLVRLERQYGPLRVIWKIEFQRRGAPHLMLFVQRPESPWLPERQSWLDHAWAEIAGGPWRATWIEWQGDPVRYVLKYLRKDAASKEYQHRVPEGYRRMGRWWGLRNMKPRWQLLAMTVGEFFTARRLMARWRKASARSMGKRLRFRPGSRVDGMWVIAQRDGRSVASGLLAQIVRAARSMEGRTP